MKTSAVIATLAMAGTVAAQTAATGLDLNTLVLLQLLRNDEPRSSRRGILGGDLATTLLVTGGLGGAAAPLDLTTIVALDEFGNAQYYGRNAFGELLPLALLSGGSIAGLSTADLTTMYALDEVAGDNSALPLLALTGNAGLPASPLTSMWALNSIQRPRAYAPRVASPMYAPRRVISTAAPVAAPVTTVKP